MLLAEKLLLQSYRLLDYDWTPLNQNQCWVCNVDHHCCALLWYSIGFGFASRSCLTKVCGEHNKCGCAMINLLYMTYVDASIVSAKSCHCATIHWSSSCVIDLHWPHTQHKAVHVAASIMCCWQSQGLSTSPTCVWWWDCCAPTSICV